MADIKENALTTKSPVAAGDKLRGLGGSDSASYNMLVQDVAKYIIENYAGSTVAGSAQSVKSALDSLNSKSTLTITRTENAFANETSISRLFAYKKGNMLFLNGNFSLTSAKEASTGETEVAQIAGWSALSNVYLIAPCQNDGSKVMLVSVQNTGIIKINNSMNIPAGFYRFALSVPTA